MTQAQQTEARRLAGVLRGKKELFIEPIANELEAAAAELERQATRIVELEQGKCLHQIAEPAAQSEGEAFQALSELTNALRERHYGRMPAEVQAAYDKAWTIVFTGEKSAPAAPQAVQPAVPVGGQSRFKGEKDWQWCAAEHVAMVLATPSEWQNYEVRYVYAHPAEGVPAQAASEIDERAAFDDFFRKRNRLHPDTDTTFRSDAAEPWKYWKARAALAATQPAAQGMEADLTDEQIDEAFNQMPDGAAGFLKSWGYRQFARAVLAAQAKQGGA